MTTRKDRAHEAEHAVAALAREIAWPFAEAVGAGRPGADITGMPGLAPEIKARRDFNPTAWLRQAATRQGLPFVVWRPDGFGPSTVRLWPAMIRAGDLLAVLQQAGYGNTHEGTQTEGNHHDHCR